MLVLKSPHWLEISLIKPLTRNCLKRPVNLMVCSFSLVSFPLVDISFGIVLINNAGRVSAYSFLNLFLILCWSTMESRNRIHDSDPNE